MNIKLVDPHISIYVKSMGKLFKVTAICKTMDEANEIMRKDSDQAMIAESKCGLIFLASQYSAKIPAHLIID